MVSEPTAESVFLKIKAALLMSKCWDIVNGAVTIPPNALARSMGFITRPLLEELSLRISSIINNFLSATTVEPHDFLQLSFGRQCPLSALLFDTWGSYFEVQRTPR